MKSKLTFLIVLLGLVFAFNAGAETITVKDLGNKRIPLNPNDQQLWNSVPKTTIGLERQTVTEPNGGGAVSKIQVQAVHNDTFIAFLVQWSDASVNQESLNRFSDAVAIQFPSNGKDDGSVFMGDEDNMVNIWQWRADWQKDIQSGYQGNEGANPAVFSNYTTNDAVDYVATAVGNPAASHYKRSAVADLLAKGFSTLTYNPHQDVAGIGTRQGGVWKVIFLRPLKTTGEGDAAFTKGSKNFAGFAVWDGNKGERNGAKSITTNWIDVNVQ